MNALNILFEQFTGEKITSQTTFCFRFEQALFPTDK